MRYTKGEEMNTIIKINDALNGIVWGTPILILIFATGLYYTIRLGFFQFLHPVLLFKETIVKAFRKKDDAEKAPGELTSFQAAMMSVAAIVGSGNIAGVATAIVLGGPGAVFWMILAAFCGMASKFAEIALGIKYRETRKDGSMRGGAMFYLSKGLRQRWLGILFSILVVPFAFVISGIVDTNTIALTLYDNYGVPTLATGIVLAALVGIIVFGGLKRIGHVCAVIAPFMGGLYLLAGIAILILNIRQLPSAILEIIRCAFHPSAVVGGVSGSFLICLKNGVARGIFSNEAGLGTAAMVHSSAQVNDPIEQAIWGPIEVFLDTVLVCMISALAIVISGLWKNGAYEGASLTIAAFDRLLPGHIGSYISVASIVLFGFSCLISYYTYAEQAVEFITGRSSKFIIRALWTITVIVGSQTTLGFVWDLADTFNGLMIVPNLVGILLLSNEVVKMKNDWFRKKNQAHHEPDRTSL